METQRQVRLAIRVIVFLACLVGCLYQVYDVMEMYYQYPTTVDIRLDPSPFVKLPAITVCSELSSTILIEKLYADNKTDPFFRIFTGKTRDEVAVLLKKRGNREELLKRLQNMSLAKQHEYTVNQSQFIKQCELPRPLGSIVSQKFAPTGPLNGFSYSVYGYGFFGSEMYNRISCKDITAIVETINAEFKCFSLFMNTSTQHDNDINYQIPKNVAENLRFLVYITLNRDFMFNGLIYVHSPEMSHQYFAQKSVQQLDPDKMRSVNVAFDRRTLSLLPPPYSTNCHDYRDDGFQCREDCLAQCKIREYLKYNTWPGDIYANRSFVQNLSSVLVKSFSSWHTLDDRDDMLEMGVLSNCSMFCNKGDDCTSTEYDLRIVRVDQRDEDDWLSSHRFTIGVVPPKNVDVVNRHVSKFQKVELVIYIGGLVGTFLGLSIWSVSTAAFSMLACSNKHQRQICCLCCNGTCHDNPVDEKPFSESIYTFTGEKTTETR